jgi:hypothetical protein
MRWWTLTYLVLFGLLSVGGLWDDYRKRRPVLFLGCAALSNLVVGYLLLAFWYPSLRAVFGFVTPVMFIAAVGWEVFEFAEDVRAFRNDSSLSASDKRIVAAIGILATPMLCLPAFMLSGIVAFRI